MELNSRVTLLHVEEAMGHDDGNTVTASSTVWAFVQPSSMTLRFKAENANLSVDLIVHLWRHEFEAGDYNFLDIDNIRYRIESANADMNDQFVKLLVTRG